MCNNENASSASLVTLSLFLPLQTSRFGSVIILYVVSTYTAHGPREK